MGTKLYSKVSPHLFESSGKIKWKCKKCNRESTQSESCLVVLCRCGEFMEKGIRVPQQ